MENIWRGGPSSLCVPGRFTLYSPLISLSFNQWVSTSSSPVSLKTIKKCPAKWLPTSSCKFVPVASVPIRGFVAKEISFHDLVFSVSSNFVCTEGHSYFRCNFLLWISKLPPGYPSHAMTWTQSLFSGYIRWFSLVHPPVMTICVCAIKSPLSNGILPPSLAANFRIVRNQISSHSNHLCRTSSVVKTSNCYIRQSFSEVV